MLRLYVHQFHSFEALGQIKFAPAQPPLRGPSHLGLLVFAQL